MIGRHGRPDPVKWPRTREELLQAYPDVPDVRVRVLGGGELAVERLGRTPANWEVIEFGTVEPAEFLHGLDFFVYFHDPDLIEAFGRTIMEAMAAAGVDPNNPYFTEWFAHEKYVNPDSAGLALEAIDSPEPGRYDFKLDPHPKAKDMEKMKAKAAEAASSKGDETDDDNVVSGFSGRVCEIDGTGALMVCARAWRTRRISCQVGLRFFLW